DEQGGLSGAPLRGKSTALVREIAARSTIPIIASGGIMDADSAREKIEAGARLLQIYAGLIYRGPGLIREIAEALRRSCIAHSRSSRAGKPTGEAGEERSVRFFDCPWGPFSLALIKTGSPKSKNVTPARNMPMSINGYALIVSESKI